MMNNKILHTIEEHNMITPNDKIIIGLSGGSDSMALTYFLKLIRDEFNLTLLALHVNHSIRGDEANEDEKFVREWCKINGIDFQSKTFDVPKIAKEKGISTELCGRNLRYEYFNSFGDDYKIATAHNLNDSVETIIMNMIRGTTINGLCGIPPKRDNIIRPLINCTKDEINNYCNDNLVPFVVDKTNFENDYTRNVIRNNVISIFHQINPSFENAFQRMIKSNNEDAQYLNNIAKEKLEESNLNVDYLQRLDSPILSRVISNFFFEQTGIQLEQKHIYSIKNLIVEGGSVQVTGNNIVKIYKGKLCIESQNQQFQCEIINKIIISYEDFINSLEFYKNNFDFFVDCDKIVGNVCVRSRKAGDRITLSKRNCTKTIKKYFNEMSVDRTLRESIPIFIDELGVIGVYKLDVDSRVKINEETKNVLAIKIGGNNA